MIKLSNILTAAAFALAISSCSSSKHLSYFQDLPTDSIDTVVNNIQTEYSLRIQPDDELLITVTSLSPEATSMYNLPMANIATRGEQQVTGNVAMQTYIVSADGDIRFPTLGQIHVEGMTIDELTELLMERISRDVENPMVRVEIVNASFNVLGEVRAPGRYGLGKESVTVLDAIARAGDLSEWGKRENILLIRREGDKTVLHRFNMQDYSSINSPYYYLKQNDIIYVEPDKVRSDNAKYNNNNGFKLSVISTVVSGVSVIASLIIALTR